MRSYEDANLDMLEHLIEWNDHRGRQVQIDLHRQHSQWIVSFLGWAEKENPSLIARFSGESEEILERWAKSILRRYEKRKQHRNEQITDENEG